MAGQSILTSVKQVLGIDEADTAFDVDIVMHINSVFSVLHQVGVTPESGYSITGATETWEDYILEPAKLNMVRSYMYTKVRLIFDPPQTSFGIAALEKQADQFEWRLQLMEDTYS